MRKNVKRTFLTEIVGKPDLGQVNGSPAFSAVYRWYRESLEPCCWRFYASKSLKWTEIWHSDSGFWQFTGEQSDSEISTMRRNQQNSCKPHQVEYKIHVKKTFKIPNSIFAKSHTFHGEKVNIPGSCARKSTQNFLWVCSAPESFFLHGFILSPHQISRNLSNSSWVSRSRCHFAPSKCCRFFLKYRALGVTGTDCRFVLIHTHRSTLGKSLVSLEVVWRLFMCE